MIVRGYHIKWAFIACVGALVAYMAYRQYFLTTAAGRFETYIDFLTTADQVELYSTTDPWNEPNGSSHVVQQPYVLSPEEKAIYEQNRIQKRIEIDSQARQQLIAFIRDLKATTNSKPSEFEPHRFVYAVKGNQKIEFAISEQSGRMDLVGDIPGAQIPIKAVDESRVVQYFQVDIAPQLNRIQTSLHPGN